jgi:pimeloyl-ACP methyl ester carboxylesterase
MRDADPPASAKRVRQMTQAGGRIAYPLREVHGCETVAMELENVGRYERYGQGPPVLILSNPQADPAWWAHPYVAALEADGYEVITFVHTGSSFAPEAVVKDIAALVEHLDCAPIRLLGWSQGAAIAQEVTLQCPERVHAAALIAGYGRQNSVDRLLQQAWTVLADSDEELEPVRLALQLLTAYPPALLGEDGFVDRHLAGLRRWSAEPNPTTDSRARSAAFINGYQNRLAALAGVRRPCLSIGFELDADTFAVRAREVADAIPGCRYLEIADAGHLTPVTHSHLVIEPVMSFFREATTGR